MPLDFLASYICSILFSLDWQLLTFSAIAELVELHAVVTVIYRVEDEYVSLIFFPSPEVNKETLSYHFSIVLHFFLLNVF